LCDRFVERLIVNAPVEKYLLKYHSEILIEFKKLVNEKAEEMSRSIHDAAKTSLRAAKSSAKESSAGS
jgi:hypothetical protein